MLGRRDFMRYLGVLAAVLFGYPVRPARAKALALSLDKVDKLQSVGGSTMLKVQGKNVLFIRDTETTVRALDPTCTHKGCTVSFNKTSNRVECPCHGSVFDSLGKVLGGPASRDLKSYGATLEDRSILFSLD